MPLRSISLVFTRGEKKFFSWAWKEFQERELNQQPVRSKATAVGLPGSGLYQNLVLPGPHQLHTTGLHLPYLQQLAGRELCKSAN